MNSKSIADAIAGRYSGVTATVGGVTESLTHCTASLPNSIARGPALLVYPPTGDVRLGGEPVPIGNRNDVLVFLVRLLRDPANVPTRTDALYAWYDALRDRIEGDMDLGLGSYVRWAETRGPIRLELDGEQYANAAGVFAAFDVVELTVTVQLDEPLSHSI